MTSHNDINVIGKCAVCSKAYIVQTGNQPLSGIMTVDTWPAGNGADIAGHDTTGEQFAIMHLSSTHTCD